MAIPNPQPCQISSFGGNTSDGAQPSLSHRFGKQLGGFPGAREIAGPWRSQCNSWVKVLLVDTMYYHVGSPSCINIVILIQSGTCGVAIVNVIKDKRIFVTEIMQDQHQSGILRR